MKLKENIRLAGDMYYDSQLKDSPGTRIANDFLTLLTKGFAKQSAKHINAINEVPFVYRERQLHSVLAPALSTFTDAFMMESPVDRGWSTTSDPNMNDSHGWVDYWCYYRKLSFLVELKHGFISRRAGQLRNDVKKEWQKAHLQLDAIEEEAKRQSTWTNGTLRLALHVLPIFETCNKNVVKTLNDIDNLFSIQQCAMNELDRKPNWSAIWKLHEKLAGPHDFTNTTEYYPGVLFVAHVSEITRHKEN